MDGYVVQPGDTLWTIIQRLGGDPTRWRQVAQALGLPILPGDVVLIYPGQVLPWNALSLAGARPPGGGAPPPSPPSPPPPGPGGGDLVQGIIGGQGDMVTTIQRDLANAVIDYTRWYQQEQQAWRNVWTAYLNGQLDLAREQLQKAYELTQQRQQAEARLMDAYGQVATAQAQLTRTQAGVLPYQAQTERLSSLAPLLQAQMAPYQAETERLSALTPLVSSPLVHWYTSRGQQPPEAVSQLISALLQPPQAPVSQMLPGLVQPPQGVTA